MDKPDYYKREIGKLHPPVFTDCKTTLQIRDYFGNVTNWMQLNNESIPIIIEYLQTLIKPE